MTTEEKLKALINWIEATNHPEVDRGSIYSLMANFQRWGQLTTGQQQQLDSIIKEYQLTLELYLN